MKLNRKNECGREWHVKVKEGTGEVTTNTKCTLKSHMEPYSIIKHQSQEPKQKAD